MKRNTTAFEGVWRRLVNHGIYRGYLGVIHQEGPFEEL